MKHIKPFLISLALLLVGGIAHAQSNERAQLVEEFTRAAGLGDVLTGAREEVRRKMQEQVGPLLASFRRSGMSEAALGELEAAVNDYVDHVLTAWDGVQAARIYTSTVVEAMSDEELRDAIAFYASPQGQSTQNAIVLASKRMLDYINQSSAGVMEVQLQIFMERVRTITARERAHQYAQAAPYAPGTQ
jgi:hypothetical protein